MRKPNSIDPSASPLFWNRPIHAAELQFQALSQASHRLASRRAHYHLAWRVRQYLLDWWSGSWHDWNSR